MSAAFGQQVKQATVDDAFLSQPGKDIVAKTLMQLGAIPAMVKFFGPTQDKSGNFSLRWADYQRFDWSIRELPAINIFESQVEAKDSDNAFLRGMVSIQVYWPPSLRRSDLTRVTAAFAGVLENFFASKYVSDMLDEIYFNQRPMKVSGLNEYGKTTNWTPNAEGLVEAELVPVTIFDANYRIDLRAWYRALEFTARTKKDPFEKSLSNLTTIAGEYDGLVQNTKDNADNPDVQVLDEIAVTNPGGEEI